MSNKWRRFEVLLPLQFNDGSDLPGQLLAEAVLEIVDHFGAVSYETQRVEGHWRPRWCNYPRQSSETGHRRAGHSQQSALDERI